MDRKKQLESMLDSNVKVQNFRVNDIFQAINAILDGFGIGLLNRNEVMHELRAGSLVALLDSGVVFLAYIYAG